MRWRFFAGGSGQRRAVGSSVIVDGNPLELVRVTTQLPSCAESYQCMKHWCEKDGENGE